MNRVIFSCSAILGGLAGATGTSLALNPSQPDFFEARIRPVLIKHCYECHASETGRSKGGLQLDTRASLRSGGDTGPAVVPGDPNRSLLLTAIRRSNPDLEMPPQKPPLPQAVVADFEAWIRAGAVDPRESSAPISKQSPAKTELFLSYQKPRQPPQPAVHQTAWPRRPLDRFILAELEKHQLTPSVDAEPSILLRRLYFDLIGLPPTPKQAAAFTLERLESTVDELLASPGFGVRWGRHWLDVARFAESNGREANVTFPHAWRYRDYVIDAVNADVPFDRFVTEQIAGDLLPAANDAERARLLIATGFLAIGAKGLGEFDKLQFAADVADEQIDTITRSVLASSIACARCHDHKTDPFRMEDYYALAGIFKSTQTFFGNWIDSENNNDSELIHLPNLPGQLIPNKPITPQRLQKLHADLARMDLEEQEEKEQLEKDLAAGKDPGKDYFKRLQKAIGRYWSRGQIRGELRQVDEQGNALPLCMGVQDSRIENSPLYHRGEIAHPGPHIPRGFPAWISFSDVPPPPKDQSGRLELARWLTHRDQPLTARVFANRVWRHLFGTGLVRTTDNFGPTGEHPSHPELLDHLALHFMDSGWSLKALIREIVLSRTYRQSSAHRHDGFAKDPDNRLLWRMSPRRLDAEVIRDSMLAVSGQLDAARRPGSLVAELPNASVSLIGFNASVPTDLDGSRYRSIYLPVLRDHLPDALEHFDFATPTLVTGSRDVTQVPLQALYLLNGTFVQEQAASLARRLMREAPDESARVRRAFQLCFNRDPDSDEQQLTQHFLKSVRQDLPSAPERDQQLWSHLCQALLASGEFCHAD